MPMLKFTENKQNVNFYKSLPKLHVRLRVRHGIRETFEKVSGKFDQRFYGKYTKNLWDEIASKSTIISLFTENIDNFSRSHSQLEPSYQPQKHNETQIAQVLLDDQPFTVPRKVVK